MKKRFLWPAVLLFLLGMTAAASAAAFFLWRGGAFLEAGSPWAVWTAEKQAEGVSGGRAYRISLKDRRIRVLSAAGGEAAAAGAASAEGAAPAGETAAEALSSGEKAAAEDAASGQELFAETWRSPEHLRVQDFLFCDIDYDGGPELLLLCWYIGEPALWESGQPVVGGRQWVQHIYIYKPVEDGSMHAHWMASRIMQNVASWEFDESLRLFFTDQDGGVTRWDWFGWGLKYFAEGYPEVKFLVTGDCLIHQKILEQGQAEGNFDFLFEHISRELQEADFSILGQEGPFVPPRTGYSGYPLFRTPLQVGEAAVKAGFDAAACATNHALDAGAEGIGATAAFYEEKGLPCLGILPASKAAAGEPPYTLFEKNGIRIAVYNYTYGTNAGKTEALWPGAVHLLSEEETVRQELAAAREEGAADACVVLVHWGTEYSPEPDESQRRWAELFLECGVDMVVGSHPHVLQPLEVLTDGAGRQMPVFWSLGNLVSRQDQPERVRGGLAEFTLRRTPEKCWAADWDLVPVITHQTEDSTTVYLLSDYTADLAAEHRLDLEGAGTDGEVYRQYKEGTGGT